VESEGKGRAEIKKNICKIVGMQEAVFWTCDKNGRFEEKVEMKINGRSQ
jgi:hypothetical protein